MTTDLIPRPIRLKPQLYNTLTALTEDLDYKSIAQYIMVAIDHYLVEVHELDKADIPGYLDYNHMRERRTAAKPHRTTKITVTPYFQPPKAAWVDTFVKHRYRDTTAFILAAIQWKVSQDQAGAAGDVEPTVTPAVEI